MKCENCGKNEVTFIYQSNINGKVTEKHLCSHCAEELGYARQLTSRFAERMNRSLFGGDLFDEFFSPVPSLLGRMRENLFDDFFAEMPVLGVGAAQPSAPKEEPLVEEKEQTGFARMRQLNALRMEKEQAIGQEDYEKAARLRDEIRKLEAEGEQRL